MKKILPLLLLLLLLIIFCVWSKKDSIHVSSNNQAHTAAAPLVAEEIRYIDYVIDKDDNGYTLNGNFTDTQQQALFTETFQKAGQNLAIENTATNETLRGQPVIALTNKILPLFIESYDNGSIVYREEKLVISGTAKSYEAQHEMQSLLNSSTIASQDNSNVAPQVKPIAYKLSKTGDTLHFTGLFNDDAQANKIKSQLPENATSDFSIKDHHEDKGSVAIVEHFIPTFLSKYTNGEILYDNETLTVSGTVASEADLAEVEALLSHATIPVVNHTSIDPALLAKAQEAEAAKLAALEAQRNAESEAAKKARLEEEAKKAQEAEAAKLAALDAQRKADAEAAEKAKREEEAKKAQEAEAAKLAALEAQRKADAEAAEKARLDAARSAAQARLAAEAKKAEMKAKILNLFKLENIEFNVNKSTLTQKGQNTVNKLANILKEYTSVNIEIGGHTDSDGSAKYNQKLSQSRVDMVKSKLIEQSIDAQRLTAKGYGETKPLVPNTTRANKAKNRRVEITILGE